MAHPLKEWLFEIMVTEAMKLHRKYLHASIILWFVKRTRSEQRSTVLDKTILRA